MASLDGLSPHKKTKAKIFWSFFKKKIKQPKINNYKPTTYIAFDGLSPAGPHKIKKQFNLGAKFRGFDIKKLAIVMAILVVVFTSASVFSRTPAAQEKFDIYNLFKNGKFLILFQNNAELRPTGGFIGSFAVADLSYGKIKNIYIDTNINKRDDKYGYMLKKIAPEPLQTFLGDRFWTMHDANWAIDFRDSAKQAAWFYQNEGGTAVDGVIAVNASTVADLLKITGPINLPEENKIIDANNFISVLQQESEKGYYAESVANRDLDEPKTIIANLSKRLLAEANQSKYYGALASFLIQELNEKQILLYFNNPTLENITLAKNWGGKVAETRTDYLAVNNANLGGQKSSLNISQTLEFDAFINDKNEVIDNLKITRVHTGDGSWPDAENRNYMRILVPKGSRLLSAELDRADVTSAIETKDDSGKTSFCLWVNTPVGGTKILEISYELPFYLKNKKYYSLTLQKQPGELNSEAKVIVNDAVKFNDKLSTDQIVKF